ncbi:isochorismate synthase, partial [Serratia marcescens]|nr:isochorismate synthase [Serratia marcescens]MDQ9488814.1 isochorismate synthase [Serratia marcescens]MDQ9582562.1 isochorismate synthase [Serratia marcescens]MDQ9606076.1 isochorismate synthase [Serratia marcescens]MDQ9623019.1 isochorismate synthase [Serratia marcescens]
MDTAVNDINRKEMQEREEHRFAADFSPASGFFFTSPFRSLTTTGCFSRIRLPAADGADLNGEFQRSVRQAFAEARQAGIKNPLLCGAIPFDTRQPSALFIPQQSRWFDRAA